MSTKASRATKLRRELRKVENGATPSEWLIKKCWCDEEPKTLELRRKVFPNLCGPEPVSGFAQFNLLMKTYFQPQIAKQFNTASLFYEQLMKER